MASAPTVTGQDINARISGSVTAYRGNALLDPSTYKVNVPGTMEFINQPLYSYQLYPAAGATVLSFFQTPATGAVTEADTNMELAAQLPAPQMFMIQAIGIDYLPGLTAAAPVLGPRADSNAGALNDMYSVFRQGVFKLSIGAKQYLRMAPLMSMPPRSHFDAATAVATSLTAGAATQTIVQVPWAEGPVFKIVPLLLESSQNFKCTLEFPAGAVALPSTDALARIGVILYGTLYRPAQ